MVVDFYMPLKQGADDIRHKTRKLKDDARYHRPVPISEILDVIDGLAVFNQILVKKLTSRLEILEEKIKSLEALKK